MKKAKKVKVTVVETAGTIGGSYSEIMTEKEVVPYLKGVLLELSADLLDEDPSDDFLIDWVNKVKTTKTTAALQRLHCGATGIITIQATN